VLILLFLKYVSDKYANDPDALIKIPKGAVLRIWLPLKAKDIGEKMDIAISALAKENDLVNVIDVISFQDERSWARVRKC
jgi:type I restriction enzyme M protein